VRRLASGDVVRITDGRGQIADGTIVSIRRAEVAVTLGATVTDVPRPAAMQLCVPVGDRDRTLWLVEKATELGVSRLQQVAFHRSASVSTRGDGTGFARKLEARAVAALEQSGGAWLPELLPSTTVDALVDDTPNGGDPSVFRILLDARGEPLLHVATLAGDAEPVLLFGPEGGIDSDEREALLRAGWHPARLADTTLRFETAGVAAAAVLRAVQLSRG
jgi:16S rRNA (uracil1498-N3)-methyltransferase